ELISAVLSPAPNGGLVTTSAPFRDYSVGDGGDIAFFATTTLGPAVFVREQGGALETAATAAQVSPAGGTFTGFPELSSIDASGRVAFRATVSGGPSGVFLYDAVAETLTPAILQGDMTLGGREICSIRHIELGASGAIVFVGTTRSDCDAVETPIDGVFLATGGGIETIVLVGDPSPVLGTAYGPIVGPPDLNAANDVV